MSTIITAAIASDDDHFVKLVYSCREQEQAYGGSVWRNAVPRGPRRRQTRSAA